MICVILKKVLRPIYATLYLDKLDWYFGRFRVKLKVNNLKDHIPHLTQETHLHQVT
jgi:hypothetical protein